MLNIDLMKEIAAMAGYTITGTSGQDPTNKTRAQRRVNSIRTDITSRFGGRWPSQYREGWLPLTPLYSEGTITCINGSRTVTGISTTWSSVDAIAQSYKILMPDGAYYKIIAVGSDTSLTLSQPYQGTTQSTGVSYQIWQDEYTLHPEVLSIGGFLDYQLEGIMSETWPRNMKDSYPVPVNAELPTIFTMIGRQNKASYSAGTVSTTINSTTVTGSGTSWLANLQPGYEIIINGVTYHVRKINSDTSLDLYQQAQATLSGQSYSANGKNAPIIRFREPTSQRIVHYWYWAKSYPLVNDNDEDWISEMYTEVLIEGAVIKDYLDKNDVARANMTKVHYENSIKDMKVSEDNAMTGVRTVAYDIPPEARD